MKLPRPRLTVRLLMAFVALVAVVLGGVRAREHYARCKRIAGGHGSRIAEYRLLLGLHKDTLDSSTKSLAEWRRLAEQSKQRMAKVHGRSIRYRSQEMVKRLLDSMQKSVDMEDRSIQHAKRDIASTEMQLAYESQLQQKYLRAAYRPWASIPPDPPPSDPHYAADFWFKRREYSRALAECRKAMEANPEKSDPHNLRAWILATCPDPRIRNGQEAVASATRACELTRWRNHNLLDTLSAAYAEKGDFNEAIKWQEKAVGMVRGNDPNRKGMVERLELYRAGKPYRDLP